MAGISGKLARVRISAATPTSSTDQAATISADKLSVTITATGRRRWDPSVSSSGYAVCLAGTPVAAAQWTPLYGKGMFQFTTAHTTGVWTVDVPWFATAYLGQTKGWTLEARTDMLECTAFSTSATKAAWRTYVPGLNDATITLDRFFNSSSTGPVFIDRQALNLPMYVELVLNSTDQAQYVAYGYIQTDQFTEDVVDLAKETVTFKPTGPIWYTT